MKIIYKINSAIFALFIFTAIALAASGLKENMEQLGTIFREVRTTVSDTSKNSANAAISEQMLQLLRVMTGQIPEEFATLPPAQRDAATADYLAMMRQETALCTQLKSAFLSNNNSSAATILREMADLQRRAHDKYNP